MRYAFKSDTLTSQVPFEVLPREPAACFPQRCRASQPLSFRIAAGQACCWRSATLPGKPTADFPQSPSFRSSGDFALNGSLFELRYAIGEAEGMTHAVSCAFALGCACPQSRSSRLLDRRER